MPSLGVILILVGGYLIWSAYRNLKPGKLITSVLQNPSGARQAIANGEPISPTPIFGSSGTSSGSGESSGSGGSAVVAFARAQLGKPYRLGGAGPTYWDCSGLTMEAVRSAYGIKLVHLVSAQMADPRGRKVEKADLQPGDIVFPAYGHCGVYSGNGKIVHAPAPGRVVVEVPLWRFMAARRFG